MVRGGVGGEQVEERERLRRRRGGSHSQGSERAAGMGLLLGGQRKRGGCRRVVVLVGLLCCSPVLLLLACLSIPLVCLLALCQLRSGSGAYTSASRGLDAESSSNGCVEDGAPLLQRYLEEQLGLVGSGAWDRCGGGVGGEEGGEVGEGH